MAHRSHRSNPIFRERFSQCAENIFWNILGDRFETNTLRICAYFHLTHFKLTPS